MIFVLRDSDDDDDVIFIIIIIIMLYVCIAYMLFVSHVAHFLITVYYIITALYCLRLSLSL